MKPFPLFAILAIILSVSSAFVSNSKTAGFLRNGFKQLPTACVFVTDIPNSCTLSPGISCGYYDDQGVPPSLCVDVLSRP